MTYQDSQSPVPKREPVVYPRRRGSLAAAHRGERWGDSRYLAAYRRLLSRHRRLVRRIAIGGGAIAGVLVVACLALWWRLASGPIQLNAFTPWLTSAIEENFGSRERIEVGGTQIERTENGGAAVRIRDIVVRDLDGTVVASAPKAEVRVSGMSLLSGHMRAESLNLVGAELAIRIEEDGDITVFAGQHKHPIATAAGAVASAAIVAPNNNPSTALSPDAAAPAPHPASETIAAILAWLDDIKENGLDGHELRELGLKHGALSVDDKRTGKHWTFQDISVSVERPRAGGVAVTIGSDNPERPWTLTASIKPTRPGYRSIELEGRHVSASDLLLALRVGDGKMQVDLPFSLSLRGEIGPDGMPQSLNGRIIAEAGSIRSGDDDGRMDIDHAEFKLNWDAGNRVLSVPMQILSGGNRFTVLGEVKAPQEINGVWPFRFGGGSIMLTSPASSGDALVLNRIAVSGRYDAAAKRLVVDGGDIGNADVSIALSGSADNSNGDMRLAAGIAGTRMSVDSLKRLWPVFASPKVRDWFSEHLMSGTVERIVIAINAPFETLKASGPPLPDDGLSIDALATGAVIRPVLSLPSLHDADLSVHIVGRDAQISLNKGTADLPSGQKLTMSAGLFEVPDTAPHEPPARVRFKLDGPVSGAAELLAMDRLREVSGAPFDPASTRGSMSAQVNLGFPLKPDLPPGTTNYAVTVDATNFSADHMIMNQKVEAAALHVSATPIGFQLKGDVKIGGTPASLEYRKPRGDSDADIRIQSVLDEAARGNLGLDPAGAISGSIPIRVVGKVSASSADHDGRFTVESDLTPAQLDGYLPGWVKPAGKPARATLTLTTKPQSIRIDDLVIEGAGSGVKGAIELDGSGELQSANFPSYGFSDGDKASLKVDRGADGALHVVMRGDVYDGRGFVKTATGGTSLAPPNKRQAVDLDLDIKLGAVVGFDGEALRSVDLKMSRRAGEVRSFGMNAKIGRDAALSGDLRGRGAGREVVYLHSGDAGALFRFTDVYARMTGGEAVMTMDAPSSDNGPQQGTLAVRDFSIHDEAQLQRAAATGSDLPRNEMQFSSMKVDFTRAPGRVALRDGVVRGPILGGTIDGVVDYARDEVRLRGTLVPLYGANNLLGQLPVVGMFLGGQKEGLVGVTYEVVGHPGNPILNVNPFSALAPGLLRKIFEFPAASESAGDDSR